MNGRKKGEEREIIEATIENKNCCAVDVAPLIFRREKKVVRLRSAAYD